MENLKLLFKNSKNNIEAFKAPGGVKPKELGDPCLDYFLKFYGGLFVDNRWIRVLGTGIKEMKRNIYDWNNELKFNKDTIIVGDDVVGGFWGLDLKKDKTVHNVTYFAPDTLKWESTDYNFLNFLTFLANGNLSQFYKRYRWKDWEKDSKLLTDDKGFFLYPFPSTNEFNINNCHRGIVPIKEIWDFEVASSSMS